MGLKVPTDDFRNTLPHAELLRAPARARATPANAAWRDSAPKPQPCATLDTHSKKSSRSGGYLPKSAVRFLAASSLARQDSWAESGLSCQYQGSETPLHPGTPPGSPCPIRLHKVCSPHSYPCPPGHRSAPLFCFANPGQTRGCRQQAGRWLGCTGNLAGPRLRGCVGEAPLHFTIYFSSPTPPWRMNPLVPLGNPPSPRPRLRGVSRNNVGWHENVP